MYTKESLNPAGKKELKKSFYFAGLYLGKEGNVCLWTRVSDYVEKTYDKENLKKVFISGDGAQWIKNGTEFIEKSVYRQTPCTNARRNS